jgi:hypothetical protein
MRGTFQQAAYFIQQNSNLSVQAASYPVSARKSFIGSSIFLLQLILIVAIYFSEAVCAFIGVQEPEALKQKMYPMLLVWFIGNFIYGGLTQTGAFEIYKGNTLIWSKLHSKRMPTFPDLVAAFEAAGVVLRT